MAGRPAGQPQLARHTALGPVRHGPALAAPGQHRAALAQQAARPAGHHLSFQLHHAGLSLHPRARQHLADPGPAHRPGHLAGGLFQLCGGRAGQLHPQGPERPGLRHLLPDHPAALFHHPGRGRADTAPAGRRAPPVRPHGRAGHPRPVHARAPGPQAAQARDIRRHGQKPDDAAGRPPCHDPFRSGLHLSGLPFLQHHDGPGHLLHEGPVRDHRRHSGHVLHGLHHHHHPGAPVRRPCAGHPAPLPHRAPLRRGAGHQHDRPGLGPPLGLPAPDHPVRPGPGPARSPHWHGRTPSA